MHERMATSVQRPTCPVMGQGAPQGPQGAWSRLSPVLHRMLDPMLLAMGRWTLDTMLGSQCMPLDALVPHTSM